MQEAGLVALQDNVLLGLAPFPSILTQKTCVDSKCLFQSPPAGNMHDQQDTILGTQAWHPAHWRHCAFRRGYRRDNASQEQHQLGRRQLIKMSSFRTGRFHLRMLCTNSSFQVITEGERNQPMARQNYDCKVCRRDWHCWPESFSGKTTSTRIMRSPRPAFAFLGQPSFGMVISWPGRKGAPPELADGKGRV